MITQIFLVVLIVGVILMDVVFAKNGLPTESMVLRDWARNWSILPFVAGFLLAHWFAPLRTPIGGAWGYALPIFAILLGIDIYMNLAHPGYYPAWRHSLWYALAGIPTGMLLWAQPGGWSPL